MSAPARTRQPSIQVLERDITTMAQKVLHNSQTSCFAGSFKCSAKCGLLDARLHEEYRQP